MKRLAILSILGLLSVNALAETETKAFSGFYFGGEINSTKQEFSIPYSELRVSNLSGEFTANGSRAV